MGLLRVSSKWDDVLLNPAQGEHIVQLYWNQLRLIHAVSLFAIQGFERSEAVVLVLTPGLRLDLEQRLSREGWDVRYLEETSQLTFLDAEAMLSEFMVDGMPDAKFFSNAIGRRIVAVRGDGRWTRIRAFGEMVNLLWDTNLPATIRLEELWNELVAKEGLTLFCAYCVRENENHGRKEFPAALQHAHTHLIPV